MTDTRDKFERNSAYGSAHTWFAVTPHDTDPLTVMPDALFILTDGNVVAKGRDGVSGTFPVTAGQVLPIRPNIITTASTATMLGLLCK